MTEEEFFSRKRYLFLIPGLMVSAIIAEEIATDIFLPCLPLMGDYFGVGEVKSQLTISMYLLGLSVARPFYGILSDSFGRRRVLVGGMILFFISSIVCYLSKSISILIMARFAQGWGAGVAIVIGFAAVKDLFDEKRCAHIMSLMGLIIAVSPAIAPILGGYLSKYFGWQSTFLFVLTLSGLILVMIWLFMVETLPKEKFVKFSLKEVTVNYWYVIAHKRFMLYVMIQSFSVGALWTWLAGAPVLYIDHLNVPLEYYGYYGATGVGFYMVGTFINLSLIKKSSVDKMLELGLILLLIGDGLLILAAMAGISNAILIQLLNAPFAMGLAFLFPNAPTGALDSIKAGRGVGASIIGTLQMGLSAVGAFCVGYFATGTLMPISLIMASMILGSGVAFLWLRVLKSKRKQG